MDIASLGIRIESNGVARATNDLKGLEGAAGKAERATGGLARAFRMLAPLAGAAMAAFSVRALTQYADAWSDMQSRVGASIKNMEAAPAMMQRIVDIANASYSPLEQTVEIFGRNIVVLQSLGRTATEAADFTEALNHALVTTATKGQDADVVLNALSRSIAIGGLRSMEFETIMSRSPRVLEAIAEEMGTNVTSLRALAQQGKVTGQVITDALINSLEKLREEAGEMPATIGDAFTRIRTNTTALIGTLDQAWSVSGRVAEQLLGMADGIRASADVFLRLGNIVGAVVGPAFDLLASNLELVGQAGTVAGAALLGFFAGPALISGIGAATTALVTGLVPALGAVAGGIRAIGAAMMANPLGLLIGGLAAAVTAAYLFRDEIKQAIGIDVVEVFTEGANLIIGTMVGTVKAVQAAWKVFPEFMEGLGAEAWNAFLSGFEGSAISWTNPFTGEKIDLLNIDLTDFKKDVPAAGRDAISAVTAAFQSGIGPDYVGQLATSLGEAWTNAAGAGSAIADLAGGLGAPGVDSVAGAAKAANDNAKTLGQTLSDAARAAAQEWDFYRQTFSGFFLDMKRGLQDGQTFWEALGNAGANALDRIADRALSMAANGIWDWLFGAFMGAVGGGINPMSLGAGGPGFLGGGMSAWGSSFAGGGHTGYGPRTGGLDGLGGFPAILHPNETVIDHTRPYAANQNQHNDNRRGDLHIHINGSGLTEEQLGRAIANGIRDYDGALAPKVEAKFRQMQNDPRAADGGW